MMMSEHSRSSGVESLKQEHAVVPEEPRWVEVSQRSVNAPPAQNQVDWEQVRRRWQALE